PLPSDPDDQPLEPSSAPSAAPVPAPPSPAPPPETAEVTPRRVVVPSCVRIGERVEDLALYDLDGNVWELSKKRAGRTKLTLLDFWFTGCSPCRYSLPFLISLDREYRRLGLDVVGVTHEEEGTFLEKQDVVK